MYQVEDLNVPGGGFKCTRRRDNFVTLVTKLYSRLQFCNQRDLNVPGGGFKCTEDVYADICSGIDQPSGDGLGCVYGS
jgi:hypothetical protein